VYYNYPLESQKDKIVKYIIKCSLFIFITFFTTLVLADQPEYQLQLTSAERPVNPVYINKNLTRQYMKIAESMGFNFNHLFGYREFWLMTVDNNIGTKEGSENLLYSTGGNINDNEASLRNGKSKDKWELTYYSNYDITWIKRVVSIKDKSYVKILKIAKGRVPNLNLRESQHKIVPAKPQEKFLGWGVKK